MDPSRPDVELTRPNLVYFDTAIWSQLVDDESCCGPWAQLLQCVGQGLVLPVISYPMITERIGGGSTAALERMDARVTPMIRERRCVWVRDYNAVQSLELQNELAQQGYGEPSATKAIVHSLEELDVESVRTETFSFIDLARSEVGLARPPFRSLGPSFKLFQERQRDDRGGKPLKPDDLKDTLVPYLPKELAGSFPEQFVLDDSRMPFCGLMLRYFSGSLKSGGGDSDSDLLDVLHLVGVAYSDCGFVDKKTYDRLRRGGCASERVSKNGEFRDYLSAIST